MHLACEGTCQCRHLVLLISYCGGQSRHMRTDIITATASRTYTAAEPKGKSRLGTAHALEPRIWSTVSRPEKLSQRSSGLAHFICRKCCSLAVHSVPSSSASIFLAGQSTQRCRTRSSHSSTTDTANPWMRTSTLATQPNHTSTNHPPQHLPTTSYLTQHHPSNRNHKHKEGHQHGSRVVRNPRFKVEAEEGMGHLIKRHEDGA